MSTARVPVALGDFRAAVAFLQLQPGTGGFHIPLVLSDARCETCVPQLAHWLAAIPDLFSARVSMDFVSTLPETFRYELGTPVQPYRAATVCAHLVYLTVADTARFVLGPIVEQVVVDDHDLLASVVSALTSQGSTDDALSGLLSSAPMDAVSRAQLVALGFDPDSSDTMRDLLLAAVSRSRCHAPRPDGLVVEETLHSVELGGHLGQLEWAPSRPLRVSASSATYVSRRRDEEWEWSRESLVRADDRLQVCTEELRDGVAATRVLFDAPYDVRPEYVEAYQHGDSFSTGPWWRPDAEEFSAYFGLVSTEPFACLSSVSLPESVVVADGAGLTGRVGAWALHANPWTGALLWRLELSVVSTRDGVPSGPSVYVVSPHCAGQRVRVGDQVRFEQVTMTGHASP